MRDEFTGFLSKITFACPKCFEEATHRADEINPAPMSTNATPASHFCLIDS